MATRREVLAGFVATALVIIVAGTSDRGDTGSPNPPETLADALSSILTCSKATHGGSAYEMNLGYLERLARISNGQSPFIPVTDETGIDYIVQIRGAWAGKNEPVIALYTPDGDIVGTAKRWGSSLSVDDIQETLEKSWPVFGRKSPSLPMATARLALG